MTYDKDSFLAGLSVGMSLRYSKRIPAPQNYLTFSSPSSFTLSVANATKNWDGTLEYSTDARSWNLWDGTTTITAINNGNEYRLYVRGIGNSVITGRISTARAWSLVGSNIYCIGDIRTLLDYSDPESTIMGEYAFAYLFYSCTSLITAPSLPATSLVTDCYYSMFHSCSSLVSAPLLPATSLALSCYFAMFAGCSSLTVAPSLPATSLAGHCYYAMFSGCTALTAAPNLPATTLSDNCYDSMFRGCSSLVSAPLLPATSLASDCYYAMFHSCSSLETLPSLPATSLNYFCYAHMFDYCSNIKVSDTQTGDYQIAYRIPSSGTGTVGANSLLSMFRNTGGTFTGTPTINTTYYTSNTVIS